MQHVIVNLQSLSPYQQGGNITDEKLPREQAADYEKRTWKSRAHINSERNVFIPAMCFKKSLERAAQLSGEQIPGKGKSTYTKHFLSGVPCTQGPTLPYTVDDIAGQWVFVPADGKAGSGKRVWKCFPTFEKWQGEAEFYIYDDIVTRDVFERHMRIAGLLVGIGVWRQEKGGLNGRFEPVSFEWQEVTM